MSSDITVVIPSIPPRDAMLCNRALPSVLKQTLLPDDVIIVLDHEREGAGPNRTRGLRRVQTEWTAFLDDDDELHPNHLATLHGHALAAEVDVVWSLYDMGPGNVDPLPHLRGKQWNPAEPHLFPITALVRTELAQRCEFPPPVRQNFSGDDFPFWLQLNELGARFGHVDEVTWRWHHHYTNTSGAPGRW